MSQAAHVRDPREVSRLFGRIAPRYDLLNRVMSLGQDLGWRRALVALVRNSNGPLLDLCTGTGDVALEARAQLGGRCILGADASLPMMRAGRMGRAGHELQGLIQADAVRLPLRRGSVGAITVAFGVRNVAAQDELFRELGRVLRPGGRLAILDIFSPASGFVGAGYDFYLRRLVPALGALLGGDGPAYRHLAASVRAFGRPADLAGRLSSAGFAPVGHRSLNLGTIGLVWGDRP